LTSKELGGAMTMG